MINTVPEVIPIERHPCDFNRYLKTILAPLSIQAAGFDIGLRFNYFSPLPEKIAIDPQKIGWVVTALIGNAFRFVRHGSRNLPGGAIQLDVGYDLDRQRLLLSVKDDGPGINPTLLPRLFEKRVDDQEAAFGLALKLAHDIAIAHGGTLRVETYTNGDQRGTTFFLEVPAPPVKDSMK